MRPEVHLPYYRSLAPLLSWREQPRPADWASVFGRRGPLTLEIGTGSGEFLAREAAEHPERDHVGIEMRWASAKRTLRRLEQAGVRNVRLILDDARPVLERLFAPRSIARVFILFPCPWRKEKHERHRLMHRSFLELLNGRLADDGEIRLVTDWTPFVEWTLAQLPGSGLRARREIVAAHLGTKYERKWLGRGQARFHELTLTKIEHRDAPVPEDAPMNPPRLERFDLAAFEPQDEIGPVTISFKEVVRDERRALLMVRTIVVEESLTQHVWLTIARGEGDTWWVVPARGCQAIPTAGLQRALERLAGCARATDATR